MIHLAKSTFSHNIWSDLNWPV